MSTVSSPALAELLRLLADHDGRSTICFVLDAPSELLPGRRGHEANDALFEARHEGLITGEHSGGDGSIAIWSQVWPTLLGLRTLEQWPPDGREWELGPWDDGVWGLRARPVLEQLRRDPPHHGFLFGPTGGDFDPDPWLRWHATLLLLGAGLVDAQQQAGGLDEVRVTARGRATLNPRARSALDEAEAKMRSGARVDAVLHAVELGLGGRLRELAGAQGVATSRPGGSPVNPMRLIEELRGAGVLDETDRAEVEGWIKLRNDLAPYGADRVSN